MRDLLPNLGADGIACFLARKTGAHIWIGNGNAESGGMLQSALQLQQCHLPPGPSPYTGESANPLGPSRP